MSNKVDLLESLIKNDSIKVGLIAKDSNEAIKLCIQPLIDKRVVDENYYLSILESVKNYGPYFIIADHVAMPHAQNDVGVFDNGFSLITLEKEIYFEGDNRPIDILIGLASASADMHVSVALPQIVSIFENEDSIEKVRKSKNKEEIIEIIKSIDLKKYL